MKASAAIVALVLLLVSVTAFADTPVLIYDNGNPVQTGTIANAAFMSDPASHAADDFRLSVDASLTKINWKGWFDLGGFVGRLEDNFEIRIYPDHAGLPASPPVTGAIYQAVLGNVPRQLTGEKVFDTYDIYEFSSVIPQFDTHAGTKYWIEMFDNIDTSQWLWSCSSIVDGGNGVTDYTGDWEHHIQRLEFTFQLSGQVVPEPSTLMLLSLGAIGLLFARRRFAK